MLERSVAERLERYRTLTTGSLLGYLPRKEPSSHLWDLAPSYPLRPGKGLRPALCLATCRAFGGEIRSALHCAVAIELLHNAFLLHDDVEDGSAERRGLPTLNAEHGIPIAVNVGDALNALAMRVLIDGSSVLGPSTTLAVFGEFERMARESVEGQAIELGWIRDNSLDLGEQDYLRMVLKKTCWYTCIEPCRIGALVATAGVADLDVFNEFGFFMGAAFQIQDDVLNLAGDGRYGKEIGGDIYEGKRTLMLLHAYRESSAADRERIAVFLALPRAERRAREAAWVREQMERTGAITRARECARELSDVARDRFETVYGPLPDSADKRLIRDLVNYVTERDL